MDVYTLSIIAFFIILGILIYKDRKNIEFKYILLMRRTKKFRKFIDKMAQKSPLFWKIVSTIGIIVCFYYMLQGLYLLSVLSYNISVGVIKEPALQFILPTPSATGSTGPGYILIPFWFWIITIFCILVPHELSHGIIARAEKIKLKSVGLLLLAIFPGAFVEPQEKQIKKAKTLTKLRIFSAGSFANFLVSFVVFLLTLYVIWPMAVSPGIQLISVNSSSPAEIAGLKGGMILTEINGIPITTSYNEYLAGRGYFYEEIGYVQPNETITVKSNGNNYNIALAFDEETNTTYMGITYSPVFKVNTAFFIGILIPLLTMISLFSLAVGIINILPIYPLDGGLIIQALTDRFFKKRSKAIVKAITYVILLILIYDFVGPFL
ncbi:MAG: site-2 protease family protein [Candidatus Aenigmatarchaeota archaeon]